MAGPTMDDLKTYLRIDGDEDDDILVLLIEAANEYLTDAGVPEEAQYSAKYNLAVMLLVSLNYENRNPAAGIEKLGFGVESIILQLKTG